MTVKSTIVRMSLIAAVSSVPGLAAAAADDVSPPISAPYERQRFAAELPEDGLVLDVGVGAAAHPKRVGLKTLVVDPVPVLEFQWGRDFHASLVDGVTFTPVHFGPVAVGGVVEMKQTYANARLGRGLRNADIAEAGGLVRYFSPIGDFEARYRMGLDGDTTHSADFTYDVGFTPTKRLTTLFELRAGWSSQAFAIPQRRSRLSLNGRPLETVSDSYSVGAQAVLDYQLSRNWRLIAIASKDEIVDAGKQVLKLQTRSVPVYSVVLTRRIRLF
jgi:hypothetical protein